MMHHSGLPFKMTTGGSTSPSSMMVTATVTRLVLFVNVRVWTVLTPITYRVLFAFIMKYTGIWSMFRMKRWSQ